MTLASLWLYVGSLLATGFAVAMRATRFDPLTLFGVALLGLLLLCWAELIRHRRRDGFWLADPCVLVTVWIFGIYYGVSNVIYFFDEGMANAQYADISAMTDLTLMAVGACFLMWRGYGVPMLTDIARWLERFLPRYSREGRSSARLSVWVCATLFLTSIAARLLNIGMGTFGYAQEGDSVERWLDYAYAIRILGGLGLVVLAGVALTTFQRHGDGRRPIVLLVTLTVVEMAFGFISGFKQAVVMPILIVAACYYICRKRVPKGLLIASAVALFLAYFIVQPFRAVRYEDSGFNPYSVLSIVSTLSRAYTESQVDAVRFVGETAQQISYRLNMTGIGAEGLVFSREVGSSEGDPDFLGGFLKFPLLAYVPRLMWPNKPEETLGGWYTQVVLGRPEDLLTSSGMGPLTFLYFGGGIVAILLGFFVLGMLYRIIREVLLHSRLERSFLYISILPILVILEAGNLHTVLVTLLRMLPILLVVQYLMFERSKGLGRSMPPLAQPVRRHG